LVNLEFLWNRKFGSNNYIVEMLWQKKTTKPIARIFMVIEHLGAKYCHPSTSITFLLSNFLEKRQVFKVDLFECVGLLFAPEQSITRREWLSFVLVLF
jgi:hypothetical protein